MRFVRTLAATAVALTLALPALAHDTFYSATLTGPAESPPNASPGLGAIVVTINDHDFTMRVQTTFSDLLGTVTASHIHCCTAVPLAGTAGVATVTPTFTGFPLGNTFGSYDMTYDMTLASSWNAAFIAANGGSTGSAFSALLAGLESGRAYMNIHTTFAPGGEIRGFLRNVTPVPEPESYALMLAGLAVVGGIASRRRASA